MKRARTAACAAVIACAAVAAGAAEAANDGWHLELTPYAWFVNLDGSVSVGDKTADFSADFQDLIDKVDFAGGLKAIGSYNRCIGFVQVDYFSLCQDFSKGPGGELNADMLLLGGAAGYRFDGFVKGSWMDLLAGARYQWNQNEIEVNGRGSNEDSADLVDGIVMVRGTYPLSFITEKLHLDASASIGAGDSDLVWELQPDLRYQFTDRFGVQVGYRRLEYEFSDGRADVDLGFQGFLIGMNFAL